MRVGVIILAAGASTRMGSPKQLLPYKGRLLICHAVQQAQASQAQEVIVVLGANSESIAHALQPLTEPRPSGSGSLSLINNPRWPEGMGTSIQTGVQAAAHLDAVIITLGDQPLIGPEILNTLIAMHERTGKPIVAASYSGIAGVPALFSKEFFEKLLQLPPAAGCKALIEAHSTQAILIDCPEGALDIDTPEDYAKANPLKSN